MFTGNIPRKAAFKYINAFSFLFLFFSCTLGVLMGLDELSFVGLCKKKRKNTSHVKARRLKPPVRKRHTLEVFCENKSS